MQSKIDADLFGVVDTNTKPKIFFKNQKLVNFKKLWFYHDYIKKNSKKIDFEYLNNFENIFNINLWELCLNERFFYKYNRFYKFKKHEILSILEQELKLFETILDDVKPDFFLTFNPVLHHQKLLLDMCRVKGIKILSSCRTGIGDQTVLVEDGATLDLDLNKKIDEYKTTGFNKNFEQNNYDLDQKIWIQKRNVKFFDKLVGLKDYLLDSNSFLINSNFMYFGRTKFKVIKDALKLEYKKNRNYNFLNKFFSSSPDVNVPFVYFPMNINEEASLLHYAPYFTNQIEVIRHIAKSIPIDYLLYVKEHVAAGLRGWNEINYYKEIMEIPNVKLIHPKIDNNTLIKNSKLLISIRGTSILKAVKFGIPSITFGKQPYQIIPSVFGVESISDLPNLIKTALKSKPESLNYEKFKSIFNVNGFSFPLNVYEVTRNQILFSGNGVFSNVKISSKDMIKFLKNNEKLFTDSVETHLKLINNFHQTPK
jgi:hypothetical protein